MVHQGVPWFPDQREVPQDPPDQNAARLELAN